MESLTTFFDEAPPLPGELHASLQALYGGNLALPRDGRHARAYCYANFVTSLDGIVSFELPKRETGSEVSGGSQIDHVVMGILRSLADAVIWGSKTYRAARRFVPTPAAIWPAGAADFAAQRASHGLAPTPIAVIVSQSGDLPLTGAALCNADQPAIIATTSAGAARIAAFAADLPNTAVWTFDAPVTPSALLARLWAERGVATALHEGGARLLGSFLADRALDELFVTRAPQVIGRSADQPRPGLAEGVAFTPETAPWARILSLKRSGSYLFARYGFPALPTDER
ncbi:MAG: dihydrofolate reductase family protein [Ktedonobacterales bacterium]|nr:dihydrofolate reductase family protein [Ktedonobacterales bacterium]